MPEYKVTRSDGTGINPGDPIQVDNNMPATYQGIASPPWGDDSTGEWDNGQINIRYHYGANDTISPTRAYLHINEI